MTKLLVVEVGIGAALDGGALLTEKLLARPLVRRPLVGGEGLLVGLVILVRLLLGGAA